MSLSLSVSVCALTWNMFWCACERELECVCVSARVCVPCVGDTIVGNNWQVLWNIACDHCLKASLDVEVLCFSEGCCPTSALELCLCVLFVEKRLLMLGLTWMLFV